MGGNDEVLPPAFRVMNEHGTSSYVLICEHASRFIPACYNGLGLPASELQRHIAWDIGAEAVAMTLSASIDAPLVLANYSRLLIDLNRPPQSNTAMPEISESTVIPGNVRLSGAERRWRIDTLFTPFQDRVSQLLDARLAAGRPTALVAVHSFTPVFKGVARPWQAGVLYRRSRSFGEALIAALGGAAAGIAANQPYQIDDGSDYTVPVHGEARGLDAVLVELRQDLIADAAGAALWARRLAEALSVCTARPSATLPAG
jgi:predicted N-formylglutamate amidohydrolase